MQKSSACPSLLVTCSKFDLPHRKAGCAGGSGDFLSLGEQRFGAKKQIKMIAFCLPGFVKRAAQTTSPPVQTNCWSASDRTKKWRPREQSAPLPAQIRLQQRHLQVFVSKLSMLRENTSAHRPPTTGTT